MQLQDQSHSTCDSGISFSKCSSWCTCADSEAGLLAHVAQADRDAVSTARLQPFKQVLHCVVRGGQLVVPFHLTDHVPHVDCICLKTHSRPERVRTGGKKDMNEKLDLFDMIQF